MFDFHGSSGIIRETLSQIRTTFEWRQSTLIWQTFYMRDAARLQEDTLALSTSLTRAILVGGGIWSIRPPLSRGWLERATADE